MMPLFQNLYQFTTYMPPIDFTIHQYLLASDPAILFASGTIQQARRILPSIREILNGRDLKYIFVSHMESDECGGLPVFLEAYPELNVICSSLGARELPGYGYTGKTIVGTPYKILNDGDLSLGFFSYPSEVHLQNGLLCYDETTDIFYSSDLMLSFGNAAGKTVKGNWEDIVAAISLERIPNEAMLKKLQESLLTISPKFIAVGHGFCINTKE